MAQIKIPTPLRVYTDNESVVTVEGTTVAAALASLVAQYPELDVHLFSDGKLRSFVNVFLGDEDIRFLNGVDTELDGSEDLRIIPSIAGGY